eukprot:m.266410 g.266410  ORF g.266410 m.266410 type:complete len:221 (-) comp30726_c0_seq1:151-813(-)
MATQPTSVFLWVPNLIGYTRIILCLASLPLMSTSPYTSMFLYWLSAFLDAFDGYAARKLNQCSQFGSVLDMVSDRCTTLALWMCLGSFYPTYIVYFQLVAILDIGSHWIHMHSTLSHGATSHKKIDLGAHWLLKFYYHNRIVLFSLCAANELFFMALYFIYFSPGPLVTIGPFSYGVWYWLAYISGPLFALKACISVVQMIAGCQNIAALDTAEARQRLS